MLKEAESLQAAGYDVSIVGIQDANEIVPFETRESGVSVYRTPWRAANFRPRGYIYLAWILGPLAVAVAAWALPGDFITRIVASLESGAGWLAIRVAQSPGLITLQVGVTLAAVYFSWRGYRRFRARRAIYSELRMSEFSVQWPLSEEDRARLARRPPKLPFRPPIFMLALAKFPTNFPFLARQLVVARRERAIAELCLRLEPDIVHCHDVGALPVGVMVKAARRSKLVFDAHEICDQLAQASGAQNALNRHIATFCADEVDAFITINDSIATYYQRSFPLLPKPAVVRNAAVRAAPFRYDGRLHDKAGIEPSDKILLYQGGFAQRRGLLALVAAAPLLPPDWIIVMMGWGRLEAELRLAARAEVSEDRDRVRFIAAVPQDELVSWTAGATIGIIPYENVGLNHWFCTPNKLWEYPNAGVPILRSPFPEMRQVIEEYGIGWLLPARITGKGVAETLSRIGDAEIAEAKANCETFMVEDNWSLYGSRLVELYDDLQHRPRPLRADAVAPRRISAG